MGRLETRCNIPERRQGPASDFIGVVKVMPGRYPANPPSSRIALFFRRGVRPRIALRCGNRPKRLTMSRCRSACARSGCPGGQSATARSWSAVSSECAERQIEEKPELGRHPSSWPAADCRVRDARAKASVAYIRGVPRKALRGNWSSSRSSPARHPRRGPCCQFASCRGFVRNSEPLAEAAVEFRILGEPQSGAGVLPEANHGRGLGRCASMARRRAQLSCCGFGRADRIPRVAAGQSLEEPGEFGSSCRSRQLGPRNPSCPLLKGTLLNGQRFAQRIDVDV